MNGFSRSIPKSERLSNPAPQHSSYALISHAIGFDLLLPELHVRRRHRSTPGATVPETSIHEYGDFASWPCKVWLSWNGPMFPVATEMSLAQQFSENYFRGPVSLGAHGSHNFRPDFLGDSVHGSMDAMRRRLALLELVSRRQLPSDRSGQRFGKAARQSVSYHCTGVLHVWGVKDIVVRESLDASRFSDRDRSEFRRVSEAAFAQGGAAPSYGHR